MCLGHRPDTAPETDFITIRFCKLYRDSLRSLHGPRRAVTSCPERAMANGYWPNWREFSAREVTDQPPVSGWPRPLACRRLPMYRRLGREQGTGQKQNGSPMTRDLAFDCHLHRPGRRSDHGRCRARAAALRPAVFSEGPVYFPHPGPSASLTTVEVAGSFSGDLVMPA